MRSRLACRFSFGIGISFSLLVGSVVADVPAPFNSAVQNAVTAINAPLDYAQPRTVSQCRADLARSRPQSTDGAPADAVSLVGAAASHSLSTAISSGSVLGVCVPGTDCSNAAIGTVMENLNSLITLAGSNSPRLSQVGDTIFTPSALASNTAKVSGTSSLVIYNGLGLTNGPNFFGPINTQTNPLGDTLAANSMNAQLAQLLESLRSYSPATPEQNNAQFAAAMSAASIITAQYRGIITNRDSLNQIGGDPSRNIPGITPILREIEGLFTSRASALDGNLNNIPVTVDGANRTGNYSEFATVSISADGQCGSSKGIAVPCSVCLAVANAEDINSNGRNATSQPPSLPGDPVCSSSMHIARTVEHGAVCIANCDEEGEEENSDGHCVPIDCGPGHTPLRSDATGRITCVNDSCPAGQHLSTGIGRYASEPGYMRGMCVPNRDDGAPNCASSDEPIYSNEHGRFACVPKVCPGDKFKNGDGWCVPKPDPECGPFTHIARTTEHGPVCIANCDDGQEQNAEGHCVSINCGPGRTAIRSAATGRISCTTDSCSPGTHLSTGIGDLASEPAHFRGMCVPDVAGGGPNCGPTEEPVYSIEHRRSVCVPKVCPNLQIKNSEGWCVDNGVVGPGTPSGPPFGSVGPSVPAAPVPPPPPVCLGHYANSFETGAVCVDNCGPGQKENAEGWCVDANDPNQQDGPNRGDVGKGCNGHYANSFEYGAVCVEDCRADQRQNREGWCVDANE